MKQEDGARVGALCHLLQRRCRFRHILGIPICIGKAPKDTLVAQLLCQRQRVLAKLPLGEAEVSHLVLIILLHIPVQHGDLLCGCRAGHLVHSQVAIGVVALYMALGNHALDQCRVLAGKVIGHKEYSMDLLFL